MLPRCAGNEPAQLALADADMATGIAWPHKASALQAAGAQPDAGSVVDQHFEAIGALVGKEVGAVYLRTVSEALHDARQQAVDAASHISGLQAQPDVGDWY